MPPSATGVSCNNFFFNHNRVCRLLSH